MPGLRKVPQVMVKNDRDETTALFPFPIFFVCSLVLVVTVGSKFLRWVAGSLRTGDLRCLGLFALSRMGVWGKEVEEHTCAVGLELGRGDWIALV